MRAAVSYVSQKLGTAILVGRDDVIKENAKNAGVDLNRAASRSSMRGCRARTGSMPTISTSACSAKASCSATASG